MFSFGLVFVISILPPYKFRSSARVRVNVPHRARLRHSCWEYEPVAGNRAVQNAAIDASPSSLARLVQCSPTGGARRAS